MKFRNSILILMLLVFFGPGCSPKDSATDHESKHGVEQSSSARAETSTKEELAGSQFVTQPTAQLFENMGKHEQKISTESPDAQQYFNQGLTWLYAFNHAEAIRSFTRAAELDENCAMAWWGVSVAAGPHYNLPPMNEQRNLTAWTAMQRALDRLENASPLERALIEALKSRNPELHPEDRSAFNEAYAKAMRKVWEAHPDDSDVGTLYADAMMVRRPWRLYSLDHEPHEDTPRILETLESVLKMNPDHPGALHLYVHVLEASGDPGQGLVAADRLCDLVPGSGHLLHMPCHIYVQTGNWEKAIIQSEKAMRADKGYRALSPEQTVQHVYMTHNAHMLAYAAMMIGREKEAMTAAQDMWENVSEGTLRKLGPGLDRWMCSVYDVQKRFGHWDAIIDEPAPPQFMPVTTAQWHAAQAVAYAVKGDFENAELKHKAFKEVVAGIPEETPWGRDSAKKVLEVADYFIQGEIALQKEEWKSAAEHLEKAAALEDKLGYGEPPQWLQPVRHTLGAVYLKSHRFASAERVYREDLAKWPNNGWSLRGLSRALEQQGKTDEAKKIMSEYQRIWSKEADPIESSCKCIPKT